LPAAQVTAGNGPFFPTKIYILDQVNGTSVEKKKKKLFQPWDFSLAEYSVPLSNNISIKSS